MKLFKVAISTVGCRANQADSGYLASHLDPSCVAVVDRFEEADVVIVNTCCVTAEAERDCRKRARRALRASPKAKVILVGCAVNAVEGFGENIDPRIEVRGGEAALPEALAAWLNASAGGLTDKGDLKAALLGRTRGLLKIQTGCTHHCAYCIVPKARGKERSMPPEQVLQEVDRFKEAGIQELVLTGVQMGAWGKDLQGAFLGDLLEKAADRMAPGRIRLSSIEPWSVDDRLLDVVAGHSRICAHLHLPLQSGDDGVLTAMRRGYQVADFLSIVDMARKRVPDIALGTDVILGFPGEDDSAFQNTLATLKNMQPAYLHAFTYSKRPGTRAAKADGQISRQVGQARTRTVRALGDGFNTAYRKAHLGTIREVIIEEEKDGILQGLTDTFVKVQLHDVDGAPGQLHSVRLISEDAMGLLGAIVR